MKEEFGRGPGTPGVVLIEEDRVEFLGCHGRIPVDRVEFLPEQGKKIGFGCAGMDRLFRKKHTYTIHTKREAVNERGTARPSQPRPLGAPRFHHLLRGVLACEIDNLRMVFVLKQVDPLEIEGEISLVVSHIRSGTVLKQQAGNPCVAGATREVQGCVVEDIPGIHIRTRFQQESDDVDGGG